MKKIQSVADLNQTKENYIKNSGKEKTLITICGGTGCNASGCVKVVSAFKREIKKQRLQDKVDIKVTGCHGFCEKGPIVVIQPIGIFYKQVTSKDTREILSDTIVNEKIIDRLLYVDPLTGKKIIYEKDVQFYKGQQRIVFADNGLLDPYKIGDYFAIGGYEAAAKALTSMNPEKIIEESVGGNGKFYKSVGCKKCGDKGFKGRIGFFEVLEMSSKIMEMAVSNATSVELQEQAIREGMETMLLDGVLKAKKGITTLEEILAVTRE